MGNAQFDPKKHRRQTMNRLIIGGIGILLIIGIGLILYFYGPGAAGVGTLCLLGGLFPILVVVVVLALIQWIVNKNRIE